MGDLGTRNKRSPSAKAHGQIHVHPAAERDAWS
jgi:hypothetical protein